MNEQAMPDFTFAFSGDDIDDLPVPPSHPPASPLPPRSAFPIANQPQLPPTRHHLSALLSGLPSRLAYDLLDVGAGVALPRRALWDVKLQIMAERDVSDAAGEDPVGLGASDLRSGLYEGGFKSWESSLDLVRELAHEDSALDNLTDNRTATRPSAVVELGCGTALPSLYLFRRAVLAHCATRLVAPLTFLVADYNPTVLELVTAPNLLLTWAVASGVVHAAAHELDLTPSILHAFQAFLQAARIQLVFYSGAWSPELDQMLLQTVGLESKVALDLLVLAAETIYSRNAMHDFAATLIALLGAACDHGHQGRALVAAKRLYFGVGGSLDAFVHLMRAHDVIITFLREENEGVRRAVVQCILTHI